MGAETRVEVVTEGVLTRMLLDDPALSAVGLEPFTSRSSATISFAVSFSRLGAIPSGVKRAPAL